MDYTGSDTSEGWKKFHPATQAKIAQAVADGWTILIGNAPYLGKSQKWNAYEVKRIAQTNSPRHGHCIRTVWAVKPRQIGLPLWQVLKDAEPAGSVLD